MAMTFERMSGVSGAISQPISGHSIIISDWFRDCARKDVLKWITWPGNEREEKIVDTDTTRQGCVQLISIQDVTHTETSKNTIIFVSNAIIIAPQEPFGYYADNREQASMERTPDTDAMLHRGF